MSAFAKMLGLRGGMRQLNADDDHVLYRLERACYGRDALRYDEIQPLLTSRYSRLVLAHTHYSDIGYMSFGIGPRSLLLERCGVLEKYRRDGYTREMLGYALEHFGRDRVLAAVPEYNLNAQLWLRALGFKCVKIMPEYFRGTEHPVGYLMRYTK
jgi:ribosomal protein S18 acetylase RimI-like enzyme